MLYSVGRLCLVIVASLVVAGCGGGGPKKVAVFKVTGKLTLQGQPLARAVVTFSPREGQPVAFGMTNDKGEFTLTTYTDGDGAAAGSYGVMVSKAVSSGPTTTAAHSADPAVLAKAEAQSGHDASVTATSNNLVPAAYLDANQTPLDAKVDPKGKNEFTFDVPSGP